MTATLIAGASGNSGALTNGSSIPGTTGTAVADGAATHFDTITGPGTGLTTLTTVTNTLNGTGALCYNLHQDTTGPTVSWKSVGIPAQQTDWTVEWQQSWANLNTGNCNMFKAYSDGALVTAAAVLKVAAGGIMTMLLGTGNTTVLSPSYHLVAATNYQFELEVVSATSVRLVVSTIAGGGALTTVYDSGVTSHAIACPAQSMTIGLTQASTGIVDMKLGNLKFGSGPGLFTAPTNTAPVVATGTALDATSGGSATFTSTGTTGTTIASASGSFTILPPGVSAPTLTGSATGTGTASAALNQTATLTTPGAYGWTASYSDGTLTTTATQMAYVSPASATFADPQSVTLGVWTNQGGAANAQAAIADTNAATYLEGAPGNPVLVTLPPLPAGALSIEYSGYYNLGALTRTLTLYMADGVTQVDTTSYALPSTDGAFTWAANDAGNKITTVALRRALILKAQDA